MIRDVFKEWEFWFFFAVMMFNPFHVVAWFSEKSLNLSKFVGHSQYLKNIVSVIDRFWLLLQIKIVYVGYREIFPQMESYALWPCLVLKTHEVLYNNWMLGVLAKG